MKTIILFFILFTNILFASTLDYLLQEYETTSENSLKTVDEKLGHVLIYSQKELRLMQYNTLDDILKELPTGILNKNRFGLSTLALTGSKSSSGFFRFFINDHEISSAYSQSASLSWGNLPLDFVDHVEVYYGESSFSLGNVTGVYFIRIYTKSATKENGGKFKSKFSTDSSNSQSILHSESFENGWSYLFFLNNDKSKNDIQYKISTIENNSDKKHLYLDVSNENTKINIGYTNIKKAGYLGFSLDAVPDKSKIKADDLFIDITKYFLDDKSIKTSFSIDIENRKYEEKNNEGMALIPVLNLASMGTTIPKELNENLKFTKTNAYISKSTTYKDNHILAALNISNKQYKVKNRTTVNFLNEVNDVMTYNNFDEETIYSLLFQDDYRVNKDLILIANFKFDKYERNGYLDDFNENLFRFGAIYTPFENFGLKSFYTETYLPPSFNNVDFVNKNNLDLKSQKYMYYTIEGVYTTENSKFSVLYHNVKIDDFMYFTPIGFVNIDHRIKTKGVTFSYEYKFSQKNKVKLNYFATELNDNASNSRNGGYAKFMGEYQKFGYFTSLIYKNSYEYYSLKVKDSFDLGLGITYNFTKDFSCSIKGQNLLNNSTKSLYTVGFPGTDFSLKNDDRSVLFTVNGCFDEIFYTIIIYYINSFF